MLRLPMSSPSHDSGSVRAPFEGALVRLRPIEESDLPWINREFWNPRVTRFLLMTWPEPVGGTRAWWEAARADPSMLALTIETPAGDPVGICALENIRERSRTAELGIWIAEGHWGRGLGTDAVRTLCRFGFREMNLQRIELRVFETNPRGQRAYQKAGFREEGRLRRGHFVDGRYVDVVVMGLLAEELIEG
jgi:RimJ/RimL family protein N-acetyltransferase